jgi:hypothetical protein
MWDFSRPKPATSKWRRVTAEELARQVRTGAAIQRKINVLEAGGTVLVQRRNRHKASDRQTAPVHEDEAAGLRVFLSVHGRDIHILLQRAESDQQQLQIARAYRDVILAVPGAHVAWVKLVGRLSL